MAFGKLIFGSFTLGNVTFGIFQFNGFNPPPGCAESDFVGVDADDGVWADNSR